MKVHIQLTSLFLSLVLAFSCEHKDRNMLEYALNEAGENRAELEKVLKHYENEPEKLRAAEFLIANMPEHFTYTGKVLDWMYHKVDSINRLTPVDECRAAYDSILPMNPYAKEEPKLQKDVESVKAEFLIKDIDLAFISWKNGDWATHINFEEFCELILPYRYGNEKITDWRKELREAYMDSMVILEDPKKYTSYWGAGKLSNLLKKQGLRIEKICKSPVEWPETVLRHIKMGECEDYVDRTTAAMRACGIPVAIDYTPAWPFRGSGHSWNVVLDISGKFLPFMGGKSNPGYPHKTDYLKAKVFRRTYGYQEGSLYDIHGDEAIPPTFNTPFIKDVSEEYFKPCDVTIKLKNKTGHRFAYLCVFNNLQWVPVQWGVVKRGKVVFEKMGRNVVYLAAYYNEDGLTYDATGAFLLDYQGEIHYFYTEKKHTQRMVLHRKYPIFAEPLFYSTRVVGGWFEGSNHRDFKDARRMATIRRNPAMRYDTVYNERPSKTFRYWRYLSPHAGCCNVAEIKFYSNGIQLRPQTILGMDDTCYYVKLEPDKAFDGDELTYSETRFGDGGWVGVDFGRPVIIDYFKYLPRNDDNNVVEGQDYELCYWEGGRWQTIERKTATCDSLIFRNVPTGGLYRLKNNSKGHEERIFTFERGRVIWR